MSQELYAKWLPIDKPLTLQRGINRNLKGQCHLLLHAGMK